ncbi:unnamed protein product [Diatraea saccharalis]|uniref:Uncharacterized protein n=1 Tax=Diatraea saccharalis TaxID=40085 RepID=A0A9N9RBH5_9NEOP|nr:unnamed protein product [Diatraea saccharalis]
MEGGRQSRLLSRLLGRLRGDHRYSTLDKNISLTSTVESTGCSTMNDDEDLDVPVMTSTSTTNSPMDANQFAANIDLRYGGQYLTPEQLPEFCDQLYHLVEIVRNIQSYSEITGEYPSELKRRLEQEAREVASLAAEARNARDVVTRTRAQRRAVRAFKKHLVAHLASMRETEVRELESTVRLSDRKLFKNWEVLKDSTDPAVFDPLLEEIRNKQTALECLVRLIENRKSILARAAPLPQPLPPPPPLPREQDDESSTTTGRRRQDNRRPSSKRRRKDSTREPRSVPLSNENSRHGPPPQVTLYIQGGENAQRCRVGSAGAVSLTPLEFPSRGSVRDILFFTTN